MNPELQAKLVTYLDGLEKGAAKVGEFAEREIPETIREWLMWMAVENFAYGTLLLVGGVASYFVSRSIYRWASDQMKGVQWMHRDPGHELAAAFGAVARVLAPVLLVSFSVPFFMKGVKVIVAPRVVIVEKVAELAKHK